MAAPKRILVIRPGGIGDAVLFVPLLQELRRVWPEVELDLLVEKRNAPVIAETGLARRVYHYDRPIAGLIATLRNRYDLVVDTEQYHRLSAVVAKLTGAARRVGFGSNSRVRLLTDAVPYDRSLYEARSFLDLAAKATGRPVAWDPDRAFFPVPDAADRDARRMLAGLGGSRVVAIHPGASIPERRWGAERYAELARLLAGGGCPIVLLGGPSDRATSSFVASRLEGRPHVDLTGRCSLMQTAAVVRRVAVYVSADSGVLHLAYGVGTPTVHLFGPGVLSKWGPPGSKFRSVRNPVPCSPCTRYGYTPPCCQGLVCMGGISPAMVEREVVASLAGESGSSIPESPQ